MHARFAKVEDVPEMVRLWEAMQTAHLAYEPRYYALTDRSLYVANAAKYIAALVADPGAICIVYSFCDQIAGSLVGKIEKKPPVYSDVTVASIDHVAVDERFRRRGVFRALFRMFEAEARVRGADSIECLVDSENQAISAYRAVGMSARQVRMLKHIQKEPSQAMQPTPESCPLSNQSQAPGVG